MTTAATPSRPAAPPQPAMPAGGGPRPLVVWFESLSRADVPLVGGKGANLGEMASAELPVPPGFVVTVEGYERFVAASGIADAMADTLRALPLDDPAGLAAGAARLRRLIEEAEVPGDVRDAVTEAYGELSRRRGVPSELVAVRSSATAEDSARFSFAGMFESFLNVRGANELLQRVKSCWASGYGARVLYYRMKQGFPAQMPVAVIVQTMVASDKSGVMFTADPSTGDPSRVVIEAAWGLGEVVVGGQVVPDHYVVDRDSLAVARRSIAHKEFMLARDPVRGTTVRVELAGDPRADAPVLDENELRALATLGRRVAEHYGAPQDVEFAIAGTELFLTQTRPITTLASSAAGPRPPVLEGGRQPIVRGLGASPGHVSGAVRVLASTAEDGKLRAGEILVTRMTSPDWVPVMRRARAIVTEAGGMTSHAAIVSREMGLPCIVGARGAMRVLADGQVVTVNADEGVVLPGADAEPAPAAKATEVVVAAPSAPPTGTRIYVNLAEPERAAEVARAPVDGVGLLRAEFMMLSALQGRHPRQLLAAGEGDDFVARLADGMRTFARAFAPRPVVYRAMDFRTNEFRGLAGGEQFEPAEGNPMIGYRGCYRYVREPDLFELELRALADVRREHGNLHLMIPFVRTGWEMRACKAVIDASALARDRGLQLWVMAEVPSVVTWLEEYVRLGVTGVSIGSNDLTQLILGVDRDGELVAPLYDERDPAVLAAIHAIIAESHRLGITCSICGQAPSVHLDYAERLVAWGIDSISVNPDVIDATRRTVAAAEQRVLLAAARRDR